MNKCGTVESMDRKEKEKQGTILLEKHEKSEEVLSIRKIKF